MRTFLKTLCLSFCSLFLATSAWAVGESISVNVCYGDSYKVAGDGVSGLLSVANANWNNIAQKKATDGHRGALSNLIDSRGKATSAAITTYSTGGGWGLSAGGGMNLITERTTKLGAMGDGYADAPITVKLQDVPYAKYDVILYLCTDNEGMAWDTVKITSGGTDTYYAYTGNETDDYATASAETSTWGTTSDIADTTNTGSYGKDVMRIKDLSGDITIYTGEGSTNRGGLAGFQIVSKEVATWTDFTGLTTDTPLTSGAYTLTMKGGSVDEDGVYTAADGGLTVVKDGMALWNATVILECELPDSGFGNVITYTLPHPSDGTTSVIASAWDATNKELQHWWTDNATAYGNSCAYEGTKPTRIALSYNRSSGTTTFADGIPVLAQSALKAPDNSMCEIRIGAKNDTTSPLTGLKVKAIHLYDFNIIEDATPAPINPGIIGINFASNQCSIGTGETTLGYQSGTKGGVIKLDDWNEFANQNKIVTVADANGNDTYTLLFNAPTTWSNGNEGTAVEKMTHGYIEANSNGSLGVTLGGLPKTGYDVAIIASGDNGVFTPFTVNGTKYTAVDGVTTVEDATIDTDDTWGIRSGIHSDTVTGKNHGLVEGNNVLYITGQTSDVLTISGTHTENGKRASLAAIMIFPYQTIDATGGAIDVPADRRAIYRDSFSDDATIVLKSSNSNRVTLQYTNSQTAQFGPRLVVESGLHTFKYGGGAGGKWASGDSNENPTILVKNGAELDFYGKDLGGWTGVASSDAVIRVNDGGTLNLYQHDGTLYYRNRFFLEEGATVKIPTSGQGLCLQGGADVVNDTTNNAQIYVPAVESADEKIAKIQGSGNIYLADDNTTGFAAFVDSNATLEIAVPIASENANAPVKKFGAGTLVLSGANTLTSTVTAEAGTLEIKVDSGEQNYPLARNNGATIVKSGAGTFVWNAATGTGPIQVNDGTLKINNTDTAYAIHEDATVDVTGVLELAGSTVVVEEVELNPTTYAKISGTGLTKVTGLFTFGAGKKQVGVSTDLEVSGTLKLLTWSDGLPSTWEGFACEGDVDVTSTGTIALDSRGESATLSKLKVPEGKMLTNAGTISVPVTFAADAKLGIPETAGTVSGGITFGDSLIIQASADYTLPLKGVDILKSTSAMTLPTTVTIMKGEETVTEWDATLVNDDEGTGQTLRLVAKTNAATITADMLDDEGKVDWSALELDNVTGESDVTLNMETAATLVLPANAEFNNLTITGTGALVLEGDVTIHGTLNSAVSVTLQVTPDVALPVLTGAGKVYLVTTSAESFKIELSASNAHTGGLSLGEKLIVEVATADDLIPLGLSATATLTGAGQVVLTSADLMPTTEDTPADPIPYLSASLATAPTADVEGWTGILTLKNITKDQIDFAQLGNASSTLEFVGVTGWYKTDGVFTFDKILFGEGGLTIDDGSSDAELVFKANAFSGTGPIAMDGNSRQGMCFQPATEGRALDFSGYTGAVTVSDDFRLFFGAGDYTSNSDPTGVVVFTTDVAVTEAMTAANKCIVAEDVALTGTLKVKANTEFAVNGVVTLTTLDLSNAGTSLVLGDDASLTVENLILGTNRAPYGWEDEENEIPVTTDKDRLVVTGAVTMAEGQTEGSPVYLVWTMDNDVTVEMTMLNGNKKELGTSVAENLVYDADAGTLTFETSLTGKGAWYEWLFDESIVSTGRNTATLNHKAGNNLSSMYFDSDNDHAVKLAFGGYTGVNYSSVPDAGYWSASIFARMPSNDGGTFISFGSSVSKTEGQGLIALVRSNKANEVLLVYVYPDAGDTASKNFEVLATMSVPNAESAFHLYTFVKTPEKIDIYLDRSLWTTKAGSYAVASGLQMGELYGGYDIGNRKKATINGSELTLVAANNAETNPAAVDMLRIYDCELYPEEVARIAGEYVYNSPSGIFTREITTVTADWAATEAWANSATPDTNADEPVDGKVNLSATVATTVSVNVAEARQLEGMDISGEGKITFAAGTVTVTTPAEEEGGEDTTETVATKQVKVTGQTNIDTDVEVDCYAMLFAGPVTVAEGKTLTLKVTDALIAQWKDEYAATSVEPRHPLTGLVTLSGTGEAQGKIVADTSAVTATGGWVLNVAYNETTQYWEATLTHGTWYVEVNGETTTWKVGLDAETAKETTVPNDLEGAPLHVTATAAGNLALPGSEDAPGVVDPMSVTGTATVTLTGYATIESLTLGDNAVVALSDTTTVTATPTMGTGAKIILGTGGAAPETLPLAKANFAGIVGMNYETVTLSAISGTWQLSIEGGTTTLDGSNGGYSGSITVKDGATLTNAAGSNNVPFGKGNTIIVESGGTVSLQEDSASAKQLPPTLGAGDVTIKNAYIAGAITTTGTVTLQGTVKFDTNANGDTGELDFSGEKSINGPSLVIEAGATLSCGTNAGDATVTIAEGKSLSGSGAITGDVAFAEGAVLVPSTVAVSGDLAWPVGAVVVALTEAPAEGSSTVVLSGDAMTRPGAYTIQVGDDVIDTHVLAVQGETDLAVTTKPTASGEGAAVTPPEGEATPENAGTVTVTVPTETSGGEAGTPGAVENQQVTQAVVDAVVDAAAKQNVLTVTAVEVKPLGLPIASGATPEVVAKVVADGLAAAELFENVVIVTPDTDNKTKGKATITYAFGVERFTIKPLELEEATDDFSSGSYIILKAKVQGTSARADFAKDTLVDVVYGESTDAKTLTAKEYFELEGEDAKAVFGSLETGAKYFAIKQEVLKAAATGATSTTHRFKVKARK